MPEIERSHRDAAPVFERIVELECKFDIAMRNWHEQRTGASSLGAVGQRWSQAVWAAARQLGPALLEPSEVERGLALAQRPVFVCGVARSGTTLPRDLLDGHPQLVVVPTESLFYTSLEQALFGLRSDRHGEFLARRWLEGLIHPPPHWLLGHSGPDGSPYVDFARNLAAWWQVPGERAEARTNSWPLAALALAYAQFLGRGRISSSALMWVEKTPGAELHLYRIWRDFPAAKVIHVVRQPEAVMASQKALVRYVERPWYAAFTSMRRLALSHRIAAESVRTMSPERYCLVRFEDLTARPQETMDRIAEFLGIEPLPSLVALTIAGRPAVNNSSFAATRSRPEKSISTIERIMLAMTVAGSARRLGYGQATILPPDHFVIGGNCRPPDERLAGK